MITIRKATQDDLTWVISELKSFDETLGNDRSYFADMDPEHPYMALSSWLAHAFFVAEKNSQPIGFVAGFLGKLAYNPKIKCLHEMLWWVDPKHRGSKAAKLLLDAFKDYGIQHADRIYFCTNVKTKVNERSLERLGFKKTEVHYSYEVSHE